MSEVRLIEVSKLSTVLSVLRGERTANEEMGALPIRASVRKDGRFEVFDGFKRLAWWVDHEKRTHVPVIVEQFTPEVTKAKLLAANAPAKTSSPMDEARVVRSLIDENSMSPKAISKVLGRTEGWVKRRMSLSSKLAPPLQLQLDRGTLSLSLALELCTFPKKDQGRLADVAARHGLSWREARAFVATWRISEDPFTRESLARDPRSALPRLEDQKTSPLGATAGGIGERLQALEQALRELPASLPEGLSDAEERVLSAKRRRVFALIRSLSGKEESHEERRDPGNQTTASRGDGQASHRPPDEPQRQVHPEGVARRRISRENTPTQDLEAGGLWRTDPSPGPEGVDGAEDPPGNPGTRIHRGPDDPGQACPEASGAEEEESEDLCAVRDGAGKGGADRLEPLPRPDCPKANDDSLLLDDPRPLPDALRGFLPG